MAITLNEEFDGPNGVAADATNTVFDNVGASGGTSIFDTATKKSGTASCRFQSTANYHALWLTRTSVTARYWSFYIRPTAHPAANTPIFYVGSDGSPGGRTVQITYNSAGTMKIQQGSSAVIVGSNTSSSLPLGEWSRIDLSLDNGAVTFALYPGNANCDNPVGTADPGNTASGTIGTSNACIQLGPTSSSTVDFHIDAFRESDSEVPGSVGTRLDAPAGFTFTSDPDEVELTASWSAVANADYYEVEIQKRVGENWEAHDLITPASSPTVITSGLDEGTTYRARVRAMPEDD